MALFVRRRWPKVAAAVAIAAGIAVLVVLIVRDRTPDTTRTLPENEIVEPAASLPPEPTPSPIPLYDVLATPAAYDGRAVAATSVPVLSVVSPSAIWVGPDAGRRVLVLIVSTERAFDVRVGARVTFSGFVHITNREFARAMGLANADEKTLTRQGAYVEVTDYTVA